MNTPYVKKFDLNGKILNPIKGVYISEFPNRKQRREQKRKHRFFGESSNYHITVVKNVKYFRVRQIEFNKDGTRKNIYHYLN